jgi:hypothetical protein
MLLHRTAYVYTKTVLGGTMTQARKATIAMIGVFGFALLGTAARADTAAMYLPPEDAGARQVQVQLVADRMFGFAPMTVNLSGMVRTDDGDLVPMNAGQKVRVVVESPLVRVQSGMNVDNLMFDLHYESFSAGPATPSPFKRAIEIRRPGNYTFRVQVIDPDGKILSSNDVSVRAL